MNDDLSKALAGVRADIDRIDGDILRLLNERAPLRPARRRDQG